MTRTIFLVLFVLAFAAGVALTLGVGSAHAHRPGLHRTPPVAPLVHWRDSLVKTTNEVRATKCLPRLVPRYAGYELPPVEWLRRYSIRQWIRKRAHAIAASSRCELARAWAWYSTGSTQCVVNGEGGWTTNTGNGYYGRFQADTDFARAYNPAASRRAGPYAYSPNWTPSEQVLMGYRGWRARGYQPWPTTGRRCGLI